MPGDWDSSQQVTADRAARLVGEQFPELRGAPVRPLAAGWDNTVVLVGPVLFRFPRREVAVPLLARELAVLPLIAPRLPLPVPVPTHVGRPAGDYPWPFWGAAPLPGSEVALLPEPARGTAAEAVGGFLRALHAMEVPVDLPVDPNDRATPARRRERTRGWLDALVRRGLWSGSTEVSALVDSPLPPPAGPGVLVHGDLHARHLLVDDLGGACGVLDWGDTCRADPAVDLSLAYAAFSGRARAELLSAYGPVDADREVRARALAVSLCAALADWAADTGDRALLPEFLRGLARAVD